MKGVYLELSGGHKSPFSGFGWGVDGPILGPFRSIKSSGDEIRLEFYEVMPELTLKTVNDAIYYDGSYYIGWSTFSGDQIDESGRARQQRCDPSKCHYTRPHSHKANAIPDLSPQSDR